MGYLMDIRRWLIDKAAERLPVKDRERFSEEWHSHLDEEFGPLPKLWHAAGCYIAAAKVATIRSALIQAELERREAELRMFLCEQARPLMVELYSALLKQRQPWVNEDDVRRIIRRTFPHHRDTDDPIEIFAREISFGTAKEICNLCDLPANALRAASKKGLERALRQTLERIGAGRECSRRETDNTGKPRVCCSLSRGAHPSKQGTHHD